MFYFDVIVNFLLFIHLLLDDQNFFISKLGTPRSLSQGQPHPPHYIHCLLLLIWGTTTKLGSNAWFNPKASVCCTIMLSLNSVCYFCFDFDLTLSNQDSLIMLTSHYFWHLFLFEFFYVYLMSLTERYMKCFRSWKLLSGEISGLNC